jgi:hypothetical protein
MSDDFEHLSDISDMQEFMDHMNTEVHKSKVPIKSLNQTVADNTSTIGLILEISIAIKISSESKLKSILLHKVLIDTGCTQTMIKSNSLPNQLIESREKPNEVSWITNSGKFMIIRHNLQSVLEMGILFSTGQLK